MSSAETGLSLRTEFQKFTDAAAMMARVVHALMLREARTRYGRMRVGYLWALVEPLIQLGVLWGFYQMIERTPRLNASLPVFLLTGIFTFQAWRNCAIRGATAVQSNGPLLNYPQVRPFSLVLARSILDLSTTLLIALLFVFALWMYGIEPLSSWSDDPLGLIGAIAGISLLAFSFAMFSSSLAQVFPFWVDVVRNLGRVLFFTSGVFYPMAVVPEELRRILMVSPIAHSIDWIRSAGLPGYESTYYSPLYVLQWSAGLLFIGLLIDWGLRVTGRSASAH